jgi:hypothetical protein
VPYTRAQFENDMVRRCGRQMAYAHLDATTVDGTNIDMNDPLCVAMGSLGYPVADPSHVTDADLLRVGPGDVGQLKAVGEWRCLESVLGNRASPDQMADTNNQQWHGSFWAELEKRAARLKADLEKQYGVGLAPIEAGVFDLGFAATTDPATGRPM